MAGRNTGYTFCNFSWSQAAHTWELSDVSRLSLPGCWKSCPGQALAALGYIDTGMTWIFVYFLSECRGHSVLRRTMCVLLPAPLRPWFLPVLESTTSLRQPLLFECTPRSCSALCSRSPVQACKLLPAPSPGWNQAGLAAPQCGLLWVTSGEQGFPHMLLRNLKGPWPVQCCLLLQSLPEAAAGGISEGFFAIS